MARLKALCSRASREGAGTLTAARALVARSGDLATFHDVRDCYPNLAEETGLRGLYGVG
jgi:hypothetical protein